MGVKYCFRYNQRHRMMRLNPDGDPIDLATMPRPHRRRREKKLMTMEEVNERFPLIKYKSWRASREKDGLPAAGGITAPPSRAGSVNDAQGVSAAVKDTRHSADTARPDTAISQSHYDIADPSRPTSSTVLMPEGTSSPNQHDEKAIESNIVYPSAAPASATAPAPSTAPPAPTATDNDDEDEDDPIRTAAPPEMLAAPGDTCAICLDTLEDDEDVRGLTCGHAFHAACLDPWLTGRRACCPLCKADYYVPKPRAELDGSSDGGAAAGGPTGRRGRAHAAFGGRWISLPGAPPSAFLGAGSRPRLILLTGSGPRAVDPYGFGIPREQPQTTAAATRSAESGQQGQRGGWRARLHGFPIRAPWRSRNAAAPAGPTPAELEAGSAARS